MSVQQKICVGVRVRPLNQRELQQEQVSVWNVDEEHGNLTQFYDTKQAGTSHSFDKVFCDSTPTEQVYDSVAKDIILGTLEGVNGTIFAYGQTSSGKTYTMQGIIKLALEDIFTACQQSERQYRLAISYLEIYNEVIKDLLNPEKGNNLKIHENVEKGIFIGGLRQQEVDDAKAVLKLLAQGEAHRSVGATQMNDMSSRSHTIFSMTIQSTGPAGSTDETVTRYSSLYLVDLAGSERASHTKAQGKRLKEGGHINKSLLTLATVIRKLSEKNSSHIPYRDSKLTRILQNALGGNSRTSIICCVTQASMHAEETLSTLGFASRAKNITNKATVNEHVDDATMIKRLQKQNMLLKRKLRRSDAQSKNKRHKSGRKRRSMTELPNENEEKGDTVFALNLKNAFLQRTCEELKEKIAALEEATMYVQSEEPNFLSNTSPNEDVAEHGQSSSHMNLIGNDKDSNNEEEEDADDEITFSTPLNDSNLSINSNDLDPDDIETDFEEDELENRIRQLMDKNERLREQWELAQMGSIETIDKLESKVLEHEAERQKFHEVLEETKSKLSETEKELEHKTNLWICKEEELNFEKSQMIESSEFSQLQQISQTNSHLLQVEEQLKKRQAAFEKLQAVNTELNAEIVLLKSNLAAKESSNSELQGEIRKLQTLVNDQITGTDSHQEMICQYQSQINQLHKSCRFAQEEAHRAADELSELTQTYQKLNADHLLTVGKLEKLNLQEDQEEEKLKATSHELDSLKDQVALYKQDLVSARSDVSHAQETIDTILEENAGLEEAKKIFLQQCNEYKNELHEAQELVEQLKSQKDFLKSELEKVSAINDQEMETLQQKYQTLQEHSQKQEQANKKEIQELSSSEQMKENQVEDLREQIDELNKKLDESLKQQNVGLEELTNSKASCCDLQDQLNQASAREDALIQKLNELKDNSNEIEVSNSANVPDVDERLTVQINMNAIMDTSLDEADQIETENESETDTEDDELKEACSDSDISSVVCDRCKSLDKLQHRLDSTESDLFALQEDYEMSQLQISELLEVEKELKQKCAVATATLCSSSSNEKQNDQEQLGYKAFAAALEDSKQKLEETKAKLIQAIENAEEVDLELSQTQIELKECKQKLAEAEAENVAQANELTSLRSSVNSIEKTTFDSGIKAEKEIDKKDQSDNLNAAKVIALQKAVKELQHELIDMQTKSNLAEEADKQLQTVHENQQAEELEARITELEQQVDAEQAAVEMLNLELETKTLDLENALREIETFKTQVATLNQEIDDLHQNIKSKSNQYQLTVNELKKENQTLKENQHSLQMVTKACLEQVEESRNQLQSELKTSMNKVEAVVEHLCSLEQTASLLDETNSQLEQTILEQNQEIKECSESLTLLEAQLDKEKSQREQTQNELCKLEESAKQSKADHKAQIQELQNLKSSHGSLKSKLADAYSKIKILETENCDKQVTCDTLLDQVSKLNAKVEDLTVENKQIEKDFNELQVAKTAGTNDSKNPETFLNVISKLETQVEKFKGRAAKLSSKFSQARKSEKTAKMDLEKLRNQVTVLEQQLSGKDREIAELKEMKSEVSEKMIMRFVAKSQQYTKRKIAQERAKLIGSGPAPVAVPGRPRSSSRRALSSLDNQL